MLQEEAGPLIERPVQEPREAMQRPAATAAPEPLLDPPGMWSRFQGLRARGKPHVGSGPPSANSCIANFPSKILPAPARRAVVVASSLGIRLAMILELAVV